MNYNSQIKGDPIQTMKKWQNYFWLLATLATILLAFALLSGCSSEATKRAHLERGESYLKDRRHQEAALEFRGAIEADRNSAEAHYGLARAYEGQGRLAETIEELRLAVGGDQKHLDARIKLGNYYLLVQPPQTAETERLINEILAVEPDHVEGHILQATLFAFQKRPDAEVLIILEKAVALDPARVESHLSVARFHAGKNNLPAAEAAFQKAVKTNEAAVIAHLEYARFLSFTNRAADAEREFQRAVQVAPDSRDALTALAGFYQANKQPQKAEAIYQQIANLDPSRPEERTILADYYQSTGRSQDAIRVYTEITNVKPEFVRGRARLGELLLGQNDVAGANAQVAEILKRNNRDTEGLLLHARIRTREGAPEEAIKDLQEVLKQERSSRQALYYMSDALIRTGKTEEARTFIGDLERYHPNYAYGRLLAVQTSLTDGNTATALKQANDLLAGLDRGAAEADSSRADLEANALILRGLAHLQSNNLTAARADLEAAQRLIPNTPGVYLNLATVLMRGGNRAEAVAAYQRALTLDDDNFDALAGLVGIYSGVRDFAQAHRVVDARLQIENNRPDVIPALNYLKATVFAAENRPPEAEGFFQRAIEINPDYLPAYTGYASLMVGQNKIDRALDQYRRALERNPTDAAMLTLMGMLDDARGNYDGAVDSYRRALDINPNQPIAANNLAWIYADQDKGNLDEAVSLAQSLVQRFPNEPGYQDTLGWAYYKKNLASVAVPHLKKAVSLEQTAAAAAGRSPNSAYRARLEMVLAASGGRATR